MSEEQTPSEGTEQTPSSEDKPNHGELIAESKAYRKRAQTAEKALEEMQGKLAKLEQAETERAEAKKIEEGKSSEIIAEMKAKMEGMEGQIAEYNKQKAERIDSLMNKLPEEKRETYQGITDLNLLENIVNDLNTGGGDAPTDRPGVPKTDFGGYKDYTEWANKDPKGLQKHFAETDRAKYVVGYGRE